ncbi:MAG: sugar ABC transporter permease [Gammaproteobacteria bacterium]|nr:sugar ABC transporter permease [Gammaproteobacteria bacterium]
MSIKRFRDARLIAPFIFIMPAVVILVVGLIIPVMYAAYLSFFDWDMGTPWETAQFLGLDNYRRMLTDVGVKSSIMVTLRYTFWTTTLEMILGILFALALEKPIKGASIFRTIFILPLMVSPIVVGLMWKYMLDARTGVINYYIEAIGNAIPVLKNFGFVRHAYLGDPHLALRALIVTDIWQWTPFIFIIILAGLQALPSESLEAAYVDGANWWKMTWHVKLPMILPLIIVTLLMRIIDVFRALEVIFIMTFGGPGRTTEVLSLKIYKTAFTAQDLGYASVISVILISITLVLSIGILIYHNPTRATEGHKS